MKKLLASLGLAAFLAASPAQAGEWNIGFGGQYQNRSQADSYSEFNKELGQLIPDFKPIKTPPHLFHLSLRGGYQFNLDEHWGIGPVVAIGGFWGMGGGLYGETYDAVIPETDIVVGEIDVTLDGKLESYVKATAGIEGHYSPLDWLQLNAGAQVGVVYMEAKSQLSAYLDAPDGIRDLARATGNMTDLQVKSSSEGTGWVFMLYAGPEFRLGDHFGIFLEGGYAFEEVPMTHVSKVVENGVEHEDTRESTVQNSGPWAALGVKVHF